jgi:hypothetical protein
MIEGDEEGLERVRREEEARGSRRRLPDVDALKERRLRHQLVNELLKIQDKGIFLKVLIEDFELQVGSKDYNSVVQAWDEYARRRKP